VPWVAPPRHDDRAAEPIASDEAGVHEAAAGLPGGQEAVHRADMFAATTASTSAASVASTSSAWKASNPSNASNAPNAPIASPAPGSATPAVGGTRPPVPPDERSAASGVIRHAALDHIRALSKNGDALVDRVITTFMHDTPRQLRSLHEGVRGADSNAVRKIAHSLKSGSANVGADALSQMCRDLETQARAGDLSQATALVAQMENEFLAVQAAFIALLEKEA
jgi:two-component system, sensor histidine kinase and response regulator